jgi:ABC-type multidrug transport system fused ATPase/permease subunit
MTALVARMRRRRAERQSPYYFLKDFRRVFPYVKPYWKLALGSVSMIGAGSLIALVSPWPLAILVDTVLGNKPLPSILGPLGGLGTYTVLAIAVAAGLAITAIENSLGVFENYVNTKLDQRMVLDFRSDLFRHAQQLSLAFHDRTKTGGLMFQITICADSVGQVTIAIPPLAQALVTLVGMFLVAYKIDPQLALVSLGVVPFIYYSVGYYTKRIEPHLTRVRDLEGQTLSIVHEAMSMLRVVKAFGREHHEFGKFRAQGETAVQARVSVTTRQTLFSLAVNTLTAAGTALVLALGALHVIDKRLTVGELLVVMGYIAAIYQPLEQISGAVSHLQQEFINLRAALNLLDTDPDVKDAPDAREAVNVAGAVEFRDVSFSYVGREDTLHEISFAAAPGQRVAVVGPTGAGKTTLITLLMRFYDVDSGEIRLDGTDLRDLTLRSLREQMSVVLQEPLLFSGSIEDNIRYGKLDASDEEIVEAAKAANAHDFIEALPKGYQTEIGERGAQLSGGERQRVCVARAFLKDAPILILDEPTSSIDSKTESLILDALDRLMEGRTTFMIAHRLSTIRHADLIVVLNHGEVVEQGTHDELLERDGLYQQLWETQIGRRQRRRAAALAAAAGDGDAATVSSEPTVESLAQELAHDGYRPVRDDWIGNAAWSLFGAISATVNDGSPEALRALAGHRESADGELRVAGQLATALLEDLGGIYELWKDARLFSFDGDAELDLDMLDPVLRRAAEQLDDPTEALRLILAGRPE